MVFQDRTLITGENPMSAPLLGQLVTAEVARYCKLPVLSDAAATQPGSAPASSSDVSLSKAALGATVVGSLIGGALLAYLVTSYLVKNKVAKQDNTRMERLL